MGKWVGKVGRWLDRWVARLVGFTVSGWLDRGVVRLVRLVRLVGDKVGGLCGWITR